MLYDEFDPVHCRFVFSKCEYLKAIAFSQRLNRLRVFMLIFLMGAFFAAMVRFGQSADETLAKIHDERHRTNYIISSYLVAELVPFLLAIFLLTPAWGRWNYFRIFRKSPLLDQELSYTISPGGVSCEAPMYQQNMGWPMIGRAREGTKGFLLYFGRNRNQFKWLPKSGFVEADGVEACRQLISENVRDFRRLE